MGSKLSFGIYGKLMLAAVFCVFAWGGTAWLALEAGERRDMIRMHIEERNVTITRNEFAQTLSTLARDTAAERAELSAIVAERDVVAMIRALEQAAGAAGASITVESVAPGSFQAGTRERDVLPAAVLTVRAEGSFATVYHFLTLLETIPFAAAIDSVSFELGEGDTWRMTARARFISEAVGE